MHHEQALPASYYIGEYELVQVLGTGGFGITYLGYDTNLDIPVAIKEYLPSDFGTRRGDSSVVARSSGDQSNFDWGLNSFLSEAKTLAQFKHPNLVQVHRYIETNHTAYIIMEYVEGDTLSEQLKENQRHYSEQELKAVLYPILDGLKELHQQNIIHRDIKPDNIIIRDSDQSPVLIDFGAARNALGHKSRSLTSIIAPSYSPEEQYHTNGEQGAWTDIYALGAVAYKCLTGEKPVESPARVRNDPLTPAVVEAKGQANEYFLQGIDAALTPFHEDRPQNIDAWKAMLEGSRDGGRVKGGPIYLMPDDSNPKKGKKTDGAKKGRMSWKKFGLILLVLIILKGLFFTQYDEQEGGKNDVRETGTQEPSLTEPPNRLEMMERQANEKRAKALVAEADKYYFINGNYKQAFNLYQQAAGLGNLSAKASLAKLWAMGRGTGKDMAKARGYANQSIKGLKLQAGMGVAVAQYQLGVLFEVVEEDYQNAEKWYRAAAIQGSALAQNNLGALFARGKGGSQSDKAADWYRQAAEQGHALAQNNLGLAYINGADVPQNDALALKWYRKSAGQGYSVGQYSMGWMYETGRGVTTNLEQAAGWYRKSAEQGYPQAQINLGVMYEFGRGVTKNLEQALVWYRKSAEQGDSFGQSNLGVMYENGSGVTKNLEQAAEWYFKSAEQGGTHGKSNLERLCKKITSTYCS